VPVIIPRKRAIRGSSNRDEHPRETSMEALGKLRPLFAGGSVTAGNASGRERRRRGIDSRVRRGRAEPRPDPIARVLGGATAGVPPRIMGIGPAPASQKLMARLGLSPADFDVIELNEAFAAQGLASLRLLGIADDDPRVNPMAARSHLVIRWACRARASPEPRRWNWPGPAGGGRCPPCASA
jgi:acetyl-CoA acetyltransferase